LQTYIYRTIVANLYLYIIAIISMAGVTSFVIALLNRNSFFYSKRLDFVLVPYVRPSQYKMFKALKFAYCPNSLL